jgi:hypothetical protein
VVSYLKSSRLKSSHQGIWTKHLKAKTELHQTVIDRCLKSLVQKQLIKSVKGVKVSFVLSWFVYSSMASLISRFVVSNAQDLHDGSSRAICRAYRRAVVH